MLTSIFWDVILLVVSARIFHGVLQAKDRSRHMSEWDVDTVVAWFHSIGYKSFDKSLREHQVTVAKYTCTILVPLYWRAGGPAAKPLSFSSVFFQVTVSHPEFGTISRHDYLNFTKKCVWVTVQAWISVVLYRAEKCALL